MKRFHQFEPSREEILYKAVQESDNQGTNKCYLTYVEYKGQRLKGIFNHSGEKITISLKQDKDYKVKFRCLMQMGAVHKSDNQVFRIINQFGQVIFSYNNVIEQRKYEAPTFEISFRGGITLEVIPENTVEYGWCVFNIIECKELGQYDQLKYAYTRLYFDLIDQCNLKCVSCYQGIHGGTGKKMNLETMNRVLEHCTRYLGTNYVSPYNWSEPFLCKNITEYLECIRRYKSVQIDLSSNLNIKLEKEKIKEILPNLVEIVFSVSGDTDEIYTHYHKGGSINKVFENIKLFVEIKKELKLQTRIIVRFGKNIYNEVCEERMRVFCEENDIIFTSVRYVIADVQYVKKVLEDEPIQEEVYNVLYHNYKELKDDVIQSLQPKCCPLIAGEVVVDTQGKLMTCCATKIVLDKDIQEVRSIEDMVNARLENKFCRECYEKGYYGYFNFNPSR